MIYITNCIYLDLYDRTGRQMPDEKISGKRSVFELRITQGEEMGNFTIKGMKVNSRGEPVIPAYAGFTKQLLIALFDELMNFIDQFTIHSNYKIDDVGKRVRGYNARIGAYN